MSTSTVDESRALVEAGEAVTNAYIELARREVVLREARQVAGEADDRVQEQREELMIAQQHLLQVVQPRAEASANG